MRRRKDAPGGPPGHLRIFRPEDWADATIAVDFDWPPPMHPYWALRAWRQARADWVARGRSWPGGEEARFIEEAAVAVEIPDQPFDPSSI